MGFVIFVGGVMGDCTPGPGCHDHDGALIIGHLLFALPIIAGGTTAVWFVSSLLHTLLKGLLPPVALNALLVAFTLAVVCFSFQPAFELFFWLVGIS